MSLLQYKTKDYYNILQISETATQEEIKKSFFHFAKLYHPDINHAPDAAVKFKEINEAFQVIGNQHERQIYDKIKNSTKITSDHFAKTAASSAEAFSQEQHVSPEQEQPSEAYRKETEKILKYRKKLIIAGIAKVVIATFFTAFLAYLYIILIQMIVWSLVGFKLNNIPSSIQLFLHTAQLSNFWINQNTIGGILSGAIIGLILGIDFHFKIETFINNNRMKKTYHLLRTLLFTFAFAFLFSMFYVFLEYMLKQEIILLKALFLMVGVLIGSTVSSDGEFAVRIKTGKGWKEILFILLRNLGFGIIGGLLGGILAFIFAGTSNRDFILSMPLTGFALFTALGSTSEEEISHMIQEIDEGTKKMIFITFVLLAVFIGLVGGFLLGRNISF